MPRRRLPLRVEPLAGEGIDSWLEATATSMHTTVGALARLAGLSVAARPPWIRWIGPDEVKALETATGVSGAAIQAMTLQSYDNRALRLDPVSHRYDPTFPFGGLLPRSRFCPQCLQATEGRLAARLATGVVIPVYGASLSTRRCMSCVHETPAATTELLAYTRTDDMRLRLRSDRSPHPDVG